MNLTSKQQIIFEITVVLGVMLLIKDIADRFGAIGAGSIAMWCGIAVATLFMKSKGGTWQTRGLSLPKGKKQWFAAAGFTLLTTFLVAAVMGGLVPTLAEFFGLSIPDSATDRFEFLLGRPLVFFAYLVVVIWLGAALGEELLMRGFLLNHLIALFGDQRIAVGLAVMLHAIIFGLLHVSQGVPGIIATGLAAIVFATVYLLNGRQLFPLILAHGIINSLGLIGYYLTNGVTS